MYCIDGSVQPWDILHGNNTETYIILMFAIRSSFMELDSFCFLSLLFCLFEIMVQDLVAPIRMYEKSKVVVFIMC